MIIECPHCESKVNGEEKGSVEFDIEYAGVPSKTVLIECSICHSPLLGFTELIQIGADDWDWGEVTRQWPAPENAVDREIPEIARLSLIEAKLCFRVKAYSACAVMCGRTIEGVCKHHNPKATNLSTGLKQLRDDGTIENRLYEWGEALRKHRNLGAHATIERVSKDDAKDLLDFSIAICEYIFILNKKFQRFKERQKKAYHTFAGDKS